MPPFCLESEAMNLLIRSLVLHIKTLEKYCREENAKLASERQETKVKSEVLRRLPSPVFPNCLQNIYAHF